MTELELEDICIVANLSYDWGKLDDSVIMISGGTGFIGSFLINVFRYRNEHYHANIKVISLSRRGGQSDETVTYLKADINKPINYDGHIDYILHLASNTHPQQYANDPVGTIVTNIMGCNNLLKLGKVAQIKRFLLASSVEIYGQGINEEMDEQYCGYIDCNQARSGYNEAKRTCEALCQSYRQQYGMDTCIFRLARVFGADKTKKDTKAMAQFIQNAVDGENIVLNSKGMQRYSYVYVADAVSGIIKVLLDGKSGEAYNISDDYEGLILGQYAEYLARLGGRKVIYDIEDNPNASRAQCALLNTTKIKEIGYRPIYSVTEGLERTYRILKRQKNNLMTTEQISK